MQPGIYPDMPASEYHARPELSKSDMKWLAMSPAHYRWYKDNPQPETDAMRIGTAFHVLALEPEKFDEKIAIWYGKVRRGKEWDSFCEKHEGKTIITNDSYGDISKMAIAVRQHPAADLILSEGRAEVSALAEISAFAEKIEGAPCRARVDWLKPHLLVDLKTVPLGYGSEEKFLRHAYNMGYHIQADFYTTIFETLTQEPHSFAFIAVEKEPPYAVGVYEATAEMLEEGEKEWKRLLDLWFYCNQQDKWPAYGNEVVPLGGPPWKKNAYLV